MKHTIFNDDQILSEEFRKQIIDEINGTENRQRKEREARKWEIWRDQIVPHVLKRFHNQGFAPETLAIMANRATCINLYKKIVSKKARSYTKGVDRRVNGNDEMTSSIQNLAKVLDMDSQMKRIDRYRHAARNCVGYIYPEKIEVDGEEKYTICLKPIFPHLYDVIPDSRNRERPRCFILSPFADPAFTNGVGYILDGGDGRGHGGINPAWGRDFKEQVIANSPRDTGSEKRHFVWWTEKYHFTTDDKGQIIGQLSPEDRANPISMLPIVNFSMDQDGEFWAQGGDDIVEGTILLNVKMTDMESILHMQGWGQVVVIGQNLKKKEYKVGPQLTMEMDYANGEEKPSVSVLSHDPHTSDHLTSAEAQVALLLTTNNLSVKSVSTNLDASTQASAIAKMVDESEVMDDISEDQQYYAAKEKEVVDIAGAWVDAYKPSGVLVEELSEVGEIDTQAMSTDFNNVEQVTTEKEKLENMKLRMEMGIASLVDIIQRDNPTLTKEQAEEKAEMLIEQAKARRSQQRPEQEIDPVDKDTPQPDNQ